MKNRQGIAFLIVGVILCMTGIVFYFTIGWFSVPVAFGSGILFIAAGIIKLILRRKNKRVAGGYRKS